GKAVGSGLGYGALWWVLGPLTLMPMMMGMGSIGSMWNMTAASAQMPSLVGHLIFGAILGFTFFKLGGRTARV
ncbi:MAG: hypothetical protein SGI84_04355, partial [Gemmatimonadota bacterium]|nr:hypothetical protein [Gemmatimonadota bacterium]